MEGGALAGVRVVLVDVPGFLRAGARVAAGRRFEVTTVALRLLPRLPISGDTQGIEKRTYVRYRSGMALRWALADTESGGTLFPDEQAMTRHVGRGAYSGLEFLHVNARSIINTVPPQSLMPFRHTINPYRGCSHACTYCFARPTHEYLGLGIGEDFERQIVVKINAVERLRAELRSARWHGEPIAMGTNTDPYQHAEGKYHLTRGIVDVLSEARNSFSILTKSTLILRDTKRLVEAAARTDVAVNFSIGCLDRNVWKLTEPGTPPPDKRVEALRRLTAAGISCGVLVAPILPGLSDGDAQLREVVEACAEAGAVSIHGVALHLRGPMREHYLTWLEGVRPDLVALHRARFAGGAYQGQAERDRVAEVVRGAAARFGISARNTYEREARVTIRPSGQLSLL
jgi:DNA repair photolyase